MLDIFKGECTINGTCQGHFLWKYCILLKKKLKLPLQKNLHNATNNKRTTSVFMLE